MRLSPLRLVALLGLLAAAARASTYEVAQGHPQASDEGPGATERPWKTLAAAAARLQPGDRVMIRGGTYRERVVINASGTAEAPIRLEAAPGEHVVVTGADAITDWQRPDDARPVFQVAWPHRFVTWNPGMTHPNDEYHRVIGRCEQVIVNGYLLRQVLSADQLAPGTFFADVNQGRLLVWDTAGRDLAESHVEASVRQELVRVAGHHVRLRGLTFRYAANMAQRGAVVLEGRHGVLEDCVIENMNTSGATFSGENLVVRRCVFRNNGQLGFGASRAHDLLFTECRVEGNNTKDFDRGWEAGGNKLVLCRNAVLEQSRFLRNRGNGIWFDIGNTNCTVRHCFIADNEDAGIFYEISFGLHAHDNVIVGNGYARNPGAWGAQAGISLSSSPGCLIERNVIAGNREGFNFREQLRTTPTVEDRRSRPIWNHHEVIRNNLIVFNRDAQLWGWFDVKDNRHWPSSSTTLKRVGSTDRDEAEAVVPAREAWDQEAPPPGLTLEDLHLVFDSNVYFAAPGQAWFKWGTTWARHASYENLMEFRAQLGLDTGSVSLDPGFADLLRLDLRLPTETLSRLKDCYPRGPVPGVELAPIER